MESCVSWTFVNRLGDIGTVLYQNLHELGPSSRCNGHESCPISSVGCINVYPPRQGEQQQLLKLVPGKKVNEGLPTKVTSSADFQVSDTGSLFEEVFQGCTYGRADCRVTVLRVIVQSAKAVREVSFSVELFLCSLTSNLQGLISISPQSIRVCPLCNQGPNHCPTTQTTGSSQSSVTGNHITLNDIITLVITFIITLIPHHLPRFRL
mmetsp:Transcript_26258/g.51555  ORF Transcript_26258/g.51555 Transcript_26258/m.51555 type:complete len:208 (-) Transcript_26258:278-901(-)